VCGKKAVLRLPGGQKSQNMHTMNIVNKGTITTEKETSAGMLAEIDEATGGTVSAINDIGGASTGNIIVKEKTINPIGMFGHVAVMKNDKTIVDYPKFWNKSYTIDIDYWLEEGRDILVLRYKDMTDEFRKRLIKNMGKYFGKDYRISSDKMNTEGFYCSQYIWYIYYITAQEMGFELDLDSDGGPYVLPYDFINSPYLEIVN